MKNQTLEVAIVGAGPGGLSAAARASQRHVSHILLEASTRHANTIHQYQKGKHIMAEPSVLPLRSDIGFEAGARETILDSWLQAIINTDINIRYQAQVDSISGEKNNFRIQLKSGDTIRAKNVILALGVQGNPRKLNIPGEDLPIVQSNLESAETFHDETIVIIGAGDSAIENALALSHRNRVILINRRAEFMRAKETNSVRINKAVERGQLECFHSTVTERIESTPDHSRLPARVILRTPEGKVSIDVNRVITRLGTVPPRNFVESIGIRFASDQADALPELSLQYESNLPGIYMIGSLAGYPLIKQAMNQGYEVIEHISGHPVQPSDHGLLEKKFFCLPFGESVDDALNQIQRRIRLFRDINPLNLRELIMLSDLLTPRPEEEIFREGQYSTSFYNILQGSVQIDMGAGNAFILDAGQFFGEMSLLSGRPRDFTVIAGENCILLETPMRPMKKLVRMEESVRQGIDKVSVIRTLQNYLLPKAPMQVIRSISKNARIHRFAAGETVFREGDPVDRLYQIRSGSVTLSRKTEDGDVVVAYCAAGNYIDLMGLSGKLNRMVTACATVATEAVSFDHSSFNAVLESDPELSRNVQKERKKQLAQYTRMQSEPEQGEILSFLMANGIGEATDVLIIDESLCVGCDNCENACAATHQGISRLDRKAGPSFYSLHIPTSCRHCEHPHCMQDCPPDAIHRLLNGEVYINDTCIGCGNCVENCPYDVIQMTEVLPQQTFLDKLLGRKTPDASKTAVKCDMCKDLKGGSACVNACPTGAAIRIHAEQVVNLANNRCSA